MAPVLTEQKIHSIREQVAPGITLNAPEKEMVTWCPQCGSVETLMFAGNVLVPTRKFHQENGKIYHDCGTIKPCRLYRSW